MRLYRSSPRALQNAFVTIKGAQFRWIRASESQMLKEFRNLLITQYWSSDEFRAYQDQELTELLRTAFATVPYYQELKQKFGCNPADIKSVEDIKYLPLLDKATVRSMHWKFLYNGRAPRFCNRAFTSGTTGSPLTVYEPRTAFSRRWSFVLRLRRWAGLHDVVQPRRAQFTGRDIVPDSRVSGAGYYWRHNHFANTLLFSTTHISKQSAPRYARALAHFHPELIDGYPSALLALARFAHTDGIVLPRPLAIIVSAETLSPTARHEIEQAFQAQVFNQYASTEPSCFWCDCEYGHLHMNPEYGISEILDENGSPALPGQAGEVVVTSFLNSAMPLIRYRLGDKAVRGPDAPCPCGRAMPRVEIVVGRTDDVLYIPGRGYVGRLDPVFKGVSHIMEAQIVQESTDTVSVFVVPAIGFTPQIEQLLRNNILEKIGTEIKLIIHKVDRIPRGPNGKFRAVLSKVSPSNLTGC